MKIAFQGIKGSYSDEALKAYFSASPEAIATGYDLSEQVCESVLKHETAMGILPVENSIVGNVTVNLDLLLENELFIIGESYHRINHCLLAVPGASLQDIKKVRSHPIALGQCQEYLDRRGFEAVPDYDTAGSSKRLSEVMDKSQATISSGLCAEYYGLEVLDTNIQKTQNNVTRFLIFVALDRLPDFIMEEKTSVAFCTNHEAGALLQCLDEFARSGVNLTKIESRPIPSNPFAYNFFVDFDGAINDSKIQECLKRVKLNTSSFKVLGSYPKADLRKILQS